MSAIPHVIIPPPWIFSSPKQFNLCYAIRIKEHILQLFTETFKTIFIPQIMNVIVLKNRQDGNSLLTEQ